MKTFDVIVAGGGMSGVAAAIAAARNGARTLIVERHNCLGGTMTAASVGPMMTFHDSEGRQVIAGIAQEIVDRLVTLDASPGHIPDTSGYVSTITPFDTEALKLVNQRLALEAGAEILFQTYITDTIVEGETVVGLVVENKGGRQLLGAQVLIDATGDADIAAQAGAPYTVGRPEDGCTQPASLMFRVAGLDLAPLRAYAHAHPEDLRWGPDGPAGFDREPLIAVCGFERTVREAQERGELHLDRDHVLFFNTHRPDEAFINMSRVTNLDPLDPWALSRAELAAREQAFEIVAFLRHHIPGCENARIIATGSQIGLRESRRIIGEYVLTGEECLQGCKFADAIARSAYPVDIHQPDGRGNVDLFLPPGETYDIPYRCLVPQQVEGLLVTGRCISTDHMAHGSTRVSPTCMALGQAAGTAAALAVRRSVTPRQVHTDELRALLQAQGASLN
jgi:2-polyprenyl-6-methoxyphenol hydroxylase-like FAD-dependent oxidoreductase